MPEIDIQLQSLEDAIRLEFIPALTGQNHLSDELFFVYNNLYKVQGIQ